MSQKPLPTLQDYFEAASRTDFPVEIIGGEIVVQVPDVLEQTMIRHTLYHALDLFVTARNFGKVYMKAACLLNASDDGQWVKDARVFDLLFITNEALTAFLGRYGKQSPLRPAPAMAVRVVSGYDTYNDVEQRIDVFLRYGGGLFFLINPRNHTIRTFTADNPAGYTLAMSDTLTGDPVLPGWSMPVADLFAV